jgi:photosystem I P700 chlorophyll a apoprotein A1
MCSYSYLTYDYSTALSAFVHHMNIGCLLTVVGAFSHYGIFMIREFEYSHKYFIIPEITCHRNIITGHLIYVNIWLAFHSFGLLVHNDTMQALSRPQDMFTDNSIALKPLFAAWVQSLRVVGYDIEVLGSKVVTLTQELGTSDLIVHHVHAFTIHCTILNIIQRRFICTLFFTCI